MYQALRALFMDDKSQFRQFNTYALEQARYTPDILKLTQYGFQHVFIFDEMQKRHRENSMVNEHGCYLGCALTRDRYAMFKHCLGKQSSPFLLEKRFHTVPSFPVYGELWTIVSSHVKELDEYKENGVSSFRKRITLDFPYRALHYVRGSLDATEWRTEKIRAWAYIGRPDYWDPLLDNGAMHGPCTVYSPNSTFKENYYAFRPKEYND